MINASATVPAAVRGHRDEGHAALVHMATVSKLTICNYSRLSPDLSGSMLATQQRSSPYLPYEFGD